MLSIEDPDPSSDPSCSSSKASDLLLHETPTFSIRDYVFKSRRKDVGVNWPFPEQLLQLCRNNGIRDPLPPFEASSLVKAHCLSKVVEAEQLPECSVHNKAITENSAPEVYAGSDGRDGLTEGIPSKKQSEKKCKLAVKLCTLTETSKPEDLASSSLTTVAVDPMASKICPVCKSFTSTSNTALNAHIDRCLSADDQSNAAISVTELPKTRVKPRKKRLMVDIYNTAPYCTLQELDRRNGTNWATDLSLVASSTAIAAATGTHSNLDAKRTKLSVLDSVNRGNVGDIYVDSNGTKLLILSEFNSSSPSVPKTSFKMKKSGKGFKAGKKKSFNLNDSKFLKDDPQHKKFRVAIKEFDDKIDSTSEGDTMDESHPQKEESMSQILIAQDQIKSSEPTVLGHWVCSKRSDLSRKLDGKDISGVSKMTVGTARKLPVKLTPPGSKNLSTERSCGLSISKASESMASSPKVKRLNILSNNSQKPVDSSEISLQSLELNSKLLPEAGDSSAGCMINVSNSSKGMRSPLRGRKSLGLKRSIFPKRAPVSLDETKVVKSEKLLISPKKRFQKHRSISGCSKWSGEECRSSTEKLDFISSRADKGNKHHQSGFSENQEKGSMGGTMDQIESTVKIAPVSDRNLGLDSIPEENEDIIWRNEGQLESPFQRSMHDQEAPYCEDAIGNEIISHDLQVGGKLEPVVPHGDFETSNAASVQEPHPCFTSFGERDAEKNQENLSTTLVRNAFNEDCDMTANIDSSGSPVSTISAAHAPSIHEDKLKDSEVDQVAEITQVQDKPSSRMVRKHKKVKSSPVKEPSCSCSQNFSQESQFKNYIGRKMFPNVFIKSSSFSSFQDGPSLDSPTESVVSMASPNSAVNTSNPILRLMGKDLVVNKERPLQLPEILPHDSDYFANTKFISFGIPSHGSLNHNNYLHYPVQPAASYHINQLQHQQMRSDKINSMSQCAGMAAPRQHWPKPPDPPYLAQEVIMLGDYSSEPGAEPRRMLASLPHETMPNANLISPQRLLSSGSCVFPSPSSLYFSQPKQ